VSDISWVLSHLNILSVIDILLVALIFYGILFLIRGTRAVQLVRGIIALLFIAILVSNFLRLTAFGWLIRNSIPALLVAIPVIFQPEIRRALERLGRAGGLMDWRLREAMTTQVIEHVCEASKQLSERRHGALIVLERETGLQEYADTGIKIDGEVSSELLLTIFHPNTALHDGAVIIREGRAVAAACILPLSEELRSDGHLGMRHRAAVGITEQSDAISIVVSEETGIISVAHNGRMIRHLDERRLRKVLQALYKPRFEARWLHRR